MSNSCPDCGGHISNGSYCKYCNEELAIYEDQVLYDGLEMELSGDFTEKVIEQIKSRSK